MQPEVKQSGNKPSSKSKSALVAALALVACLAGVAQYHRVQVSEEINDGTKTFLAAGFAGYEFVNEMKTWDEALDYCREKGMVLATVDEQWKLDLVRQVSENRNIWIGYRAVCNQIDRNCYRWMSGARRDWDKWAPHEPNNLPGELCVELNTVGHFNNHVCNSHRLPFVCDKSPYFQGYAMHGANGAGLTFDEANEYCRVRYLTTLATLGDAGQMQNVMQQFPATSAWIGLRVTPGTNWNVDNFKFISGEPIRHRLRWAPGEPNSHNERCVEIRRNGELNDILCQARLKWFLCDQFTGNNIHRQSTFEITSERRPIRHRALPAKLIYFGSRRRYDLKFAIRIDGLMSHWGSILHIGNNNHVRVPGLWLFPDNQQRLHFRQSSHHNSNEGCDPSADQTPGLGQWFRVEVYSRPGNFRVRYNGRLMCERPIHLAVHDLHKVWISNPWYESAPVTVNDLLFKVF